MFDGALPLEASARNATVRMIGGSWPWFCPFIVIAFVCKLRCVGFYVLIGFRVLAHITCSFRVNPIDALHVLGLCGIFSTALAVCRPFAITLPRRC